MAVRDRIWISGPVRALPGARDAAPKDLIEPGA
jgi:hypothetical protein